MEAGTLRQTEMSYELYQEIAGDLCEPIDTALVSEIRYELYCSKIVYLKNLYEQCFVDINRNPDSRYSHEDLLRLRDALEISQQFLRETVLECVQKAMEKTPLLQNAG